MSLVPSSSPAWIACAGTALAVAFATLLLHLRAVRRWPLALAGPIALAALVTWEAALLHALSPFHAVTRPALLAAHALLPATLALRPAAARRAAADAARALRRGASARWLWLAPLLGLVVVSAFRYAPNNWDGMTYHLARVAHWLQHRSIAGYPTHVLRQVAYPAGADDLLLALQAISGSDALAPLPQLASWVLVSAAAPTLARLASAPRSVARWAWLLPATAPMAVLQASSTQNDLVAAAVALGIVAAALPLRRRRPRGVATAALLGLTVGAGFLVKPSAIVAVAPILAWVVIARSRGRSWRPAEVAAGAAAALATMAADVAQRLQGPRLDTAWFIYPVLGAWGDRGLNLARGLLRHVPVPRAVVGWLAPFPHRMCDPQQALCAISLRPHEDYAGNPLQLVALLACAGVAAGRWRRLPPRARAGVAAVVAGYVAFQLVFRDNEFISRLQLPLLALSPALLSALHGLRPSEQLRPALRLAGAGCAALLLAGGWASASGNEARPPLWSGPVWRASSYYANRWQARAGHQLTLDALRATGCRRLGLLIGEDDYDYPLTWRALRLGVEVRHVMGQDGWPCLVYSLRGPPPPPPSGRWVELPGRAPGAEGALFVPAPASPAGPGS